MGFPVDSATVNLTMTHEDLDDLVQAAWSWGFPLGELEENYEPIGEPYGAPEGEAEDVDWKFVYDLGPDKTAMVLVRMYLRAKEIPHQFFWLADECEHGDWNFSNLLCTDYGDEGMHEMYSHNKGVDHFRHEMEARFDEVEREFRAQQD